MIDTEKKKVKKYFGFFIIKKGEWENIKSLINLHIIKTKETQSMSVLSITRTETNDVYKLFVVLPDKSIEIMSGEKDYIFNRAEQISTSLQTSVINA